MPPGLRHTTRELLTVLKLVKAGLSDDLIVTTITSSPGTYDTSANGLIALKQGGVSDKVISAIIAKSSGAAPASLFSRRTSANHHIDC